VLLKVLLFLFLVLSDGRVLLVLVCSASRVEVSDTNLFSVALLLIPVGIFGLLFVPMIGLAISPFRLPALIAFLVPMGVFDLFSRFGVRLLPLLLLAGCGLRRFLTMEASSKLRFLFLPGPLAFLDLFSVSPALFSVPACLSVSSTCSVRFATGFCSAPGPFSPVSGSFLICLSEFLHFFWFLWRKSFQFSSLLDLF